MVKCVNEAQTNLFQPSFHDVRIIYCTVSFHKCLLAVKLGNNRAELTFDAIVAPFQVAKSILFGDTDRDLGRDNFAHFIVVGRD